MPGNPRDKFRRRRLTNIDSIGFRSIQPVKLFIHVWITACEVEKINYKNKFCKN